jgi:hypothetical protein
MVLVKNAIIEWREEKNMPLIVHSKLRELQALTVSFQKHAKACRRRWIMILPDSGSTLFSQSHQEIQDGD